MDIVDIGLDALENVVEAYRSLSWRRSIDGLNGRKNRTTAQLVVKTHPRCPRVDIPEVLNTTGHGST